MFYAALGFHTYLKISLHIFFFILSIWYENVKDILPT
jgi:hypothetical protein